jgi:acetyl-CoA C-acetyltransferase
MAGIHIGFMEIAQDFADVVLVGGMEHMTRVPMGGQLVDRGHIVPNMTLFTDPAYQHWDMMTTTNMGLTAEKLISQTDFTREDIDRWGAQSHQRAAKARSEGFFDEEIFPIAAEQADGKTLTVDQDQAVREDATVEGMASLRPAFDVQGNRQKERHQTIGNHPIHWICRCGSHDYGTGSGAGQQKGPGESRT